MMFGANVAKTDDVVIEEAWARASIGTSSPAAAFMTIRNLGTENVLLVGVESPVAAKSEVHETIVENGVMKMRPVPEIELTPASDLKLEPGSLHIMLMKLNEPLVEGGSIDITIRFGDGSTISTVAPIAGVGATTPPR